MKAAGNGPEFDETRRIGRSGSRSGGTWSSEGGHALKTRLFMKGMPDVLVQRPYDQETYKLGNKFLQRVFCGQVRGFEIILSLGDNLADYAEYYGRVIDRTGTPTGEFPTIASRKASVLQDLNLFGDDLFCCPIQPMGAG